MIQYFDVSLRDGLQCQEIIYTIDEKKSILSNIIDKYSPKSIELGSIVSNKKVPQMNGSIELYEYANTIWKGIDFYLLVPNLTKYKIALENGVQNISLLYSFSNTFQMKNIRKTLEETKNEFSRMDKTRGKRRIYLSCFMECPFEGRISDEDILNTIHYFREENICLSDTMGSLMKDDFKRILPRIKEIIEVEKISLHLHYSDKEEIVKIIKYAYEEDITNFDVSSIEEGGCSITMNKNQCKKNISYEILEELFV